MHAQLPEAAVRRHTQEHISPRADSHALLQADVQVLCKTLCQSASGSLAKSFDCGQERKQARVGGQPQAVDSATHGQRSRRCPPQRASESRQCPGCPTRCGCRRAGADMGSWQSCRRSRTSAAPSRERPRLPGTPVSRPHADVMNANASLMQQAMPTLHGCAH